MSISLSFALPQGCVTWGGGGVGGSYEHRVVRCEQGHPRNDVFEDWISTMPVVANVNQKPVECPVFLLQAVYTAFPSLGEATML